jgi:Mrp family chromosome partitioning ATPase
VTRAFELRQPGLTEVLDDGALFESAVSRDPRSGLYVLGARNLSAPAREASSRKLPDLLGQLKSQFEQIIVDCPAILPVDGGALVEHADRIAFVIAWESTDRAAVEQAFQMLGTHVAKIDGVVLNKVGARWYKAFDEGRYLHYEKPAAAVAPAAQAAPKPAPIPKAVPAPAPVAALAASTAPAPTRVAVFNRRATP